MLTRKLLWVILAFVVGGLAAAEVQAEQRVRCESKDGRPWLSWRLPAR